MIRKKVALDLLKEGLKISQADETELVLIGEDQSLTRFAESEIHQSLYRSDASIFVRAIKDKKLGIAATNDIAPDAIKRAVRNAIAIADLMQADEQYPGLPQAAAAQSPTTFFRATSEFTPQNRAEAVKLINEKSRVETLQASGAFETTLETVAVVNSHGLEQYYNGTLAEMSLTVTGGEGNSGWSIGYHRDVSQLNVKRLAERAIAKAVTSRNPISLESGQYTVILEPAAVGQLLLFLGFMGFGGKTMVEKRSFLVGKIGEQIAGTNITITEDPFNPQIAGIPFDYEGVPRRRVPLIENGIARGVVYNTYYAKLAGVESTGHALPPDNSYGPYPKHLVMEGGNSSVDEMINSIDRGIYITHFWYINFLNPMKTMITGTTQDGTFLIEGGAITKPIRNMRTNQSILDALNNAELISKERELYPQYSVVMLVPALKVNNFNLEKTEG